MDRKEFIKVCGLGCLSMAGILPVVQGCAGMKQITVAPEGEFITINSSEFLKDEKKSKGYRKMLTLNSDKIKYPILLCRESENNYKAFLLRCTHQGAELSVNGNIISCPAHGSEFNNNGEVIQGPAESSLYQYKVFTDIQQIKIQLT